MSLASFYSFWEKKISGTKSVNEAQNKYFGIKTRKPLKTLYNYKSKRAESFCSGIW